MSWSDTPGMLREDLTRVGFDAKTLPRVGVIERKRRGEATSRRAACDSASMLGVPALLVCCWVFILQSVLVSLIAAEHPLHLHSLLSIWCLFIYLTGTSVFLYKASSV